MDWAALVHRLPWMRPAEPANAVLLFASTDYDDATRVLAKWAQQAYMKAAETNRRTEHIARRTLRQKDMQQRLCDETRAVVFYGHGETDKLVGDPNGTPVIDLASNWLKGRTVIAVACLAASELGVRLVENGLVPVFVGYVRELTILAECESWLGEAANAFGTAYFSPQSPPARDAFRYAQQVYDDLISWCESKVETNRDASVAIGFLKYNRAALQLCEPSQPT